MSRATTGEGGVTRLTDLESATAVVCDPDGTSGITGAWTGDADRLRRMAPKEREELRKVLAATISTTSKQQIRAVQRLREELEGALR